MSEQFYTILTTLGLAEMAAAAANSTTVDLTHIAVGDSNGNYYAPSQGQTALVHEVYRAGINSLVVDVQNANWVVAELTIPATTGGWYIREAGIISSSGNLFAVGKVPETYKPVFSEGAGKDLILKLILEVTNAESVSLMVDPSVVLASQQYVNDAVNAAKHQARRLAYFYGRR